MTPSASLLTWSAQSSLLFFSYDVTARQFIYLNPAFVDFFSLPDSHIHYSVLQAMIHPEDQQYMEEKMKECLQGRSVSDMEFRVIKGEQQRWMRTNFNLFQENNSSYIIGHGEDITVYKAHSDNLNKHNNKKNSILNILAHDLAGPIGTIANLSELIARETASLENGKLNEYLGRVRKITKSSIQLIRDFLNQEFLESQGIKLVKRRVELVGKITTVTQEYLDMQKELQLQFFCHANREVIYAEIDEDKLLQVINNLISNSMKFTPNGGTITINIEESDENVLIMVADTGVGIPEKYHATLFDKFSEARRSGLRGEHSTGLGMSIIKTIVEWHRGKIWFNSEEGKGTTFYIQLPK